MLSDQTLPPYVKGRELLDYMQISEIWLSPGQETENLDFYAVTTCGIKSFASIYNYPIGARANFIVSRASGGKSK